jgi:protein arginine kinase activator
MKCQHCNEKDATVHVTKIVNGVKSETHLCEECARQKQDLGFSNSVGLGFPISFQNIMDGIYEVMGSAQQITSKEIQCPICGMTFEDFRSTGRVGCGECYETFSSNMLPLIKRVHGNIQHTGKVPKRTGGVIKVTNSIAKLKDELRKLVENEEYESAAMVRDEIRRLESELNALGKQVEK